MSTPPEGPLRILLVLGLSSGGVGRHVFQLAESLAAQGHSVVVAGPHSTQDAFAFDQAAAHFVAVPIAARPSLTGDPRSIRTLRKLARQADVIHAHGLRAGALSALARGKTSPPPLVVTLHNALIAEGAVAAAYVALERIVANRADLVLGVSPDLEERQRELDARRVARAVIAAPTRRPLRRTVEQTRTDLGVEPGRPLVVSVARLTGQKGLPLLLDLAARLSSRHPAPLVVIAGDGPDQAALRQRIRDENLPVELLGARDDVPELLAAADVAVSTAVWEGQPIWIQEALLAGAAIVATDVGGTGAVVGDAAVLVPATGESVLADLTTAVEVLLDDEEARTTLRHRALERARELPDAGDARDAVLADYRALLTTDANDC
jgi:glycosyltransferase involved in cell wall biosynthesis